MPAEIEMLKILQVVLLVAFLSVTGLFLVLSLAKRRRLKGVLVWVPTGWVFGVPVRPILFVVVLVAILTTGILAGGRVSPYLISGYLAGAVLWGTATCLSTSVFVLDFGIVRGLVDKTDYLP